jgi:hypothetical protein
LTPNWVLVLIFVAIVAVCLHLRHARSEPLDSPYGGCDQQTLDEAVALERLGDREALRDHVRSFGCRLIWPREGLRPFPPERKEGRERKQTPAR